MKHAMLCGAFLATFVLSAVPAGAAELRIMTGPQGGSWYPLGGAIAELIKKNVPGTTATVQPGAGIINVQGVETGKAEIGFGNSVSTADGVAGREPFKASTKNVRQLATLYLQYFQIAVPDDAGVRTVADLKGKAIGVQPRGNTGELMTQHALQVYGLSYKDMSKVNHGSYNDSVSLMKDGHIQAFAFVSTVPAAPLLDLGTQRKIRLLDIPDDKYQALLKLNAGYARRTIPKGTYKFQETDNHTFGTYTHLFVSADLSDNLVYGITKALATNIPALAAVVRDVKDLTLAEMALDVGVPYHPGALKYYKEAKAIK
jgi:TRAP transporter TAXI family solute receptor